jgi:hypothetical protein
MTRDVFVHTHEFAWIEKQESSPTSADVDNQEQEQEKHEHDDYDDDDSDGEQELRELNDPNVDIGAGDAFQGVLKGFFITAYRMVQQLPAERFIIPSNPATPSPPPSPEQVRSQVLNAIVKCCPPTLVYSADPYRRVDLILLEAAHDMSVRARLELVNLDPLAELCDYHLKMCSKLPAAMVKRVSAMFQTLSPFLADSDEDVASTPYKDLSGMFDSYAEVCTDVAGLYKRALEQAYPWFACSYS